MDTNWQETLANLPKKQDLMQMQGQGQGGDWQTTLANLPKKGDLGKSYGDLSLWELAKAGDIKGIGNRLYDDVKNNIVVPAAEGLVADINEFGRAQRGQTEAFYDLLNASGRSLVPSPEELANQGQREEERKRLEQVYGEKSQWAADAGANLLKKGGYYLGMLPPFRAAGAAAFASDVIDTARNEGLGEAAKLATGLKAYDWATQDNLGEQLNQAPISTALEGLMSALPAFGVYAGQRAARGKYKEYKANKAAERENKEAWDTYEKGLQEQAEAWNRAHPQTPEWLQDAERSAAEAEYKKWWDDAAAKMEQGRAESAVGNLMRDTDPANPQIPEIPAFKIPSAEEQGGNPRPDIQAQVASPVDNTPTGNQSFFDTGHGEIDQLVNAAAAKYGIDPELVHKVIQVESAYNPNAVSHAGAQGLMQLMPDTARGLGVSDSFNVAQNIDGGVRYLKEMLDANGGDIRKALASYNAGLGGMRKGLGFDYADTVLGQSVNGRRSTAPARGGYPAQQTRQPQRSPMMPQEEQVGTASRMTDMFGRDENGVADMMDMFRRDEEARVEQERVRQEQEAAEHQAIMQDMLRGGEYRTQYQREQLYNAERGERFARAVFDPAREGLDSFGRPVSGRNPADPNEPNIFANERQRQQNAQRRAEEQARVDRMAQRIRPTTTGEVGAGTGRGTNPRDSYMDGMVQRERQRQEEQARTEEMAQRIRPTETGEIGARANGAYPADELLSRILRGETTEKARPNRNLEPAQKSTQEIEADMEALENELRAAMETPRVDRTNIDLEGKGKLPTEEEMRESVETIVENTMRENGLEPAAPRKGSKKKSAQGNAEPEPSDSLTPRARRMAAQDELSPRRAATTQGNVIGNGSNNIHTSMQQQNAPSTLGSAKPMGEYTGETVTRKQIFQKVRDLFGTARLGRTAKGTSGHYDPAQDTVRVKSYGDWETLWHEVGHKIDGNIGLAERADNASHQEFKAALTREYGNQIPYPPSEYAAEGIAHFLKDYMTNPANVQKYWPHFSKIFDRAMQENPDMGGRVAEARDMMKVDREQGLGAKIAGTIAQDEPKTFKQKAKALFDKFIPNWVDDKWALRRAEEKIEKITGHKFTPEDSFYTYARLAKDRAASIWQRLFESKNAEATMAAINKLYHGAMTHDVTLPTIMEKVKKLEDENPDWIRDNNHKDGNEALGSYLVARRMMEVHDLMTAKTGKPYKMPLKYEDYQQYVNSAPAILKKAAQDFYDFNANILTLLNKEGIVSDAAYKYMKENHKHYASMQREFPDDAALVEGFAPSNSFINVGTPIKRLDEHGSGADIKNPLQTLARNTFQALSIVERNRVGRKFVDARNMHGVGGIVEKVDLQPSEKDSTFYVWRDGKKDVYQTTPEMYQALKMFNPPATEGVLRWLGEMPASAMRAGAVVYNPKFLITNFLRDQLTGFLFSKYGYKPFYDFAKGVFHMAKKTELYEEYKNSGAMMSTIVKADRDFAEDMIKDMRRGEGNLLQKLNPKLNFPKLFDKLQIPSEHIEQATRVGAYAKARKKGASINEATMEARELTLDFGRAGTYGRAANRYMPFFNAGVQGHRLFYEKFKQNPAQMMKRGAIALGLPAVGLMALIRSDDERSREYDQMKEYEKNLFYNIPVPKDVCETGWLRYPKPFTEGLLFASLPERILDYAYTKDPRGFKDWAIEFSGSMNPLAWPPVALALVEWASGYSLFQKRDIVPQREQNLMPQDQYGYNTTETAKEIGNTLGLSPRKIDNLGHNLLAGFYDPAVNIIDVGAGKAGIYDRETELKNPLNGSITVDPYQSPQSVQDFYDRKRELTQEWNSRKRLGREMSKEEAKDYVIIQKLDKYMQKYNQAIRTARERGDDEQYKKMRKDQADFLARYMTYLNKKY